MPGCAFISVSLHITIQTVVFIETLNALISDIRWFSWNIFSTQYHSVDDILCEESADIFSCQGESLKEYC